VTGGWGWIPGAQFQYEHGPVHMGEEGFKLDSVATVNSQEYPIKADVQFPTKVVRASTSGGPTQLAALCSLSLPFPLFSPFLVWGKAKPLTLD
jgi:hypothetical protein